MKQLIFIIAATAAFMILMQCDSPSSSNNNNQNGNTHDTIAITEFCLSVVDISGWVPGTCATYDQETLYDFIDGRASVHKTHGLINGVMQELSNADGNKITAYISDFGHPDNATSMYNAAKQEAIKPLSLSSYDNYTAMLDAEGILYRLYAHLGHYYFELELRDFSTDPEAISAAETFLNYYGSLLL
jgi:hypothetical protein